MRFSYSNLDTFIKCPLKYKFKYVEKIPGEVVLSPERNFGNNLHNALKEFSDLLDKEKPTLELLIQTYSDSWTSHEFENREAEEGFFKLGANILEQYFRINKDKLKKPVLVEKGFSFPVKEHIIRGRIDKIDRLDGENALEVVDYKSSKHITPKEEVKKDLQLSIYAMAVEHMFGFLPQMLSLYFLRPNLKLSTQRTKQDINKAKKRIIEIVNEIETSNYPPNYGRLCDWCEFQYVCVGHKDKKREKNKVDPQTGVDIDAVVKEFFEVKQEAKNQDNKINGLKEIIHNYCQKHDVEKIYSGDIVVTRRKSMRYGYELEGVKKVLEPLGLFDEVIEIRSTNLKNLLESQRINGKAISAINMAKKIKSENYSISAQQLKLKGMEGIENNEG